MFMLLGSSSTRHLQVRPCLDLNLWLSTAAQSSSSSSPPVVVTHPSSFPGNHPTKDPSLTKDHPVAIGDASQEHEQKGPSRCWIDHTKVDILLPNHLLHLTSWSLCYNSKHLKNTTTMVLLLQSPLHESFEASRASPCPCPPSCVPPSSPATDSVDWSRNAGFTPTFPSHPLSLLTPNSCHRTHSRALTHDYTGCKEYSQYYQALFYMKVHRDPLKNLEFSYSIQFVCSCVNKMVISLNLDFVVFGVSYD